jgi:hypothetical protein
MDYENQGINYAVQPKDYKVWSIINLVISIIFCCSCCGLISLGLSIYALIKSNEVGNCLAMGEAGIPAAQKASKDAKTFNIVSTILLVLQAILSAVYLFIYGFSTILQSANMY